MTLLDILNPTIPAIPPGIGFVHRIKDDEADSPESAVEPLRHCAKCGTAKPQSEFYFRSERNVYDGTCKVCRRHGLASWKLANKAVSQ